MSLGLVLMFLGVPSVAQVTKVEEVYRVLGRCTYRVTYEYRTREGLWMQDTRLPEARCKKEAFQVGNRVPVSYSRHSLRIIIEGALITQSPFVEGSLMLVLGVVILRWKRLQPLLQQAWFWLLKALKTYK